MPLPPPAPRREIHQRTLEMRCHARDDGLYDIESRLIDRKPFDYRRSHRPDPVPAGTPLHDLSLRVTLDADATVRAIDAATDATPWPLCREAVAPLQSLVGQRIAPGWSSRVRERLRGACGCTHLMEMLLALGTPALQGIRAVQPRPEASPAAHRAPPHGKLDSCYAYGRERAVVKLLWPDHHRPQTPG